MITEIPVELLDRYHVDRDMGTIGEHTERNWYKCFLTNSDYEINKLREYESYLSQHPEDETYKKYYEEQNQLVAYISPYRQFAREKAEELK